MEVIHFGDGKSCEPEKDRKRVSLCNREDISIKHYVKTPGHVSPGHENTNAQVLIVLQGKLIITADDDQQELFENDAVYIPGDEPHIVQIR